MKRKFRVRLTVLLVAIMMLSMSMTADAKLGYTYNYDYFADIQYYPDAYEVAGVYSFSDLGLSKSLNNAESIYIVDDLIYIVDTGNNTIYEVRRNADDSIQLERTIKRFNAKGVISNTTFNHPTDICVGKDGCLYIADQGNERIVKLDNDLNYIMSFTKPTDATFDQSLAFLPSKLVVDEVGRVYCIADNVNKGLIKFENDGKFTGFLGATPVTVSFWDYLWKRVLSTKAQREAMENFVPTEYDNISMDKDGFIYACTMNVTGAGMRSGADKPIRKLNLMGSDILVRNGDTHVTGDEQWDSAGGIEGCSMFADVVALDNGIYFGLDKTRGRLFGYDSQGNIVFIFGGIGNEDGYFRTKGAISIDNMGTDLVVLDQIESSITIFTPTEYGKLTYQAIAEYDAGDYIKSGETWQKVLTLNGNCDLAYIGIGRSLLRQEKYEEAMKYFKLKYDDANYSKAYKQYRKQWIEEHILLIMIVLGVLIIIPLAKGKLRKLKFEIDFADIFRK